MATAVEKLTAKSVFSALHWAKRWTPNAVPARYAPHHHRLVELPEPGHSQLRSVWRGSAKSTITLSLVAWLCERRKVDGILLIRSVGSDCKGDRETLEKTCKRRGMPYEMDGEERMIVINGVPIWTRTPRSAVRGLKYMTAEGAMVRPNLLIVDDLETRETARSIEQTKAIETWLTADAMQCGGQGNPIRTIVLGTPITPTCLVSKMMRSEKPFDIWDPPLVVPILNDRGEENWPALVDPTLRSVKDGGRIDPITWATEYMLQPLPEGTLLFPPADTRWLPSVMARNVVVAVDPAGDGSDSSGITALAMTPAGLLLVDAVKYDGPRVGLPDAVWRFVNGLQAVGHTVIQVAVEAVGGWEFAADAIADRVNPIYTTHEKPRESKVERALRLTNWHAVGAFTVNEELRGSDWDVEFHSFTQEGQTITAHDDLTDSTVWAAAILTEAWSVPPPIPAAV